MCKVSVADIAGIAHSTEVTAGSLYEAVAAALASLRQDDWVGEIGTGLTTVRVEVLHPPVTHEVKMKDFRAWLHRKSGSPADMVLEGQGFRDAGRIARWTTVISSPKYGRSASG